MMKLKQAALAATLPLTLMTGTAEAAKLCRISTGSPCYNVTWACGTFTAPEGWGCVGSAGPGAKDLVIGAQPGHERASPVIPAVPRVAPGAAPALRN